MNINKKTTQLLCEKYWAKQNKNYKKKLKKDTTVEYHGYIYSLNVGCLLNNKPSKDVNLKRIISVDNDFKHLPKQKNDMVLWRGIQKEHYLFETYLDTIYKKLETLKNGDIFVNNAYMFGACKKSDAEFFMEGASKEGLLLKLNIKKGAQVSLTNFEGIMPRYSKWICKNNEKTKTGNFIELEQILPENNTKNNYINRKITKLINSIKNIFKK